MSGNQDGKDDTFEEQIYKMIMNEEKWDEFGLVEFQNPCVQASVEKAAQEYKKKYNLKKAYDGQEMLRKMRADIKREYLTRKRQLKTLQREAAVTFREAETTLQSHYSKIFANTQGRRVIDITLPLVSEVILPHGKIDLKQFNCEQEFESYRKYHDECYQFEREGAIEFMRKKEREELLVKEQQQSEQRQLEREAETNTAWSEWERRQLEQRRPYEPRSEEEPREIPWDEWVASGQVSATCLGCNDLECSDCYSYGNSDSDSYDSSYCGEFNYYPREYECERVCREREEAQAAAEAAEAAEEAARRTRWEEMSPEEEERLWSENTRNSDGELWDEQAIADEAEHRREVALMKLNDDMTYACDDYPDVQQLEVVQVTEPKERMTASGSGMISARKKAASKSSAAAATKARIAKQQQKKGKKFVPLQITINDNRERHAKNQEEQATAILSASKLEINLPKKNLQGASREAKKCHNKKWKSFNALAKQSGAREARLAYLPGAITSECMEYDSSDFDY